MMGSVDVEIYISQMVTFFENNPNDLMSLIGDIQKEEFYSKMKNKSLENVKNGDDFILTKQQLIDIVIELKSPELNQKLSYIDKVEGFILKTKFGDIFLN